jgi:hypothetical protein
MTPDPRQRIVISRDELFAPDVEEALQLHRAAEQSARASTEAPPAKFRLLYTTWFYLAVAGALGALAAWGALEPFLTDGLRFTATLQRVDPSGVPSFWNPSVPIRGRLEFNGADVYLLPGRTRMQFAGSGGHVTPDQLAPGAVVTVMGSRVGRSIMVAEGVRIEAPGAAASAAVDLDALRSTQDTVALIFFPLIAGIVGFAIGAVEGVVCRNWRRAFWSALIGLGIGLVGGLLADFVGNIVYRGLGELNSFGDSQSSAAGFIYQMLRRGLAWMISGTAMGLGQGFALKSSKLKLNGFIGGLVGGLIGGLLFDPIDMIFRSQSGMPSGALSRAIGILVIGAAVGLMIGFTDLLTRDAWLKILSGPLRGKEFSFARMPVRLGSSPQSEVYLFHDPQVEPLHAEIRKMRDAYELVDCQSRGGTWVDGQRIDRKKLADGARIRIGDSEFTYFSREKRA